MVQQQVIHCSFGVGKLSCAYSLTIGGFLPSPAYTFYGNWRCPHTTHVKLAHILGGSLCLPHNADHLTSISHIFLCKLQLWKYRFLTAGSDFGDVTPTEVRFNIGDESGATRNVTVPIIGDEEGEPDETFLVSLIPQILETSVGTSATITIIDDDSE